MDEMTLVDKKLDELLKSKEHAALYLVNGIKLSGVVVAWDRSSVELDTGVAIERRQVSTVQASQASVGRKG